MREVRSTTNEHKSLIFRSQVEKSGVQTFLNLDFHPRHFFET